MPALPIKVFRQLPGSPDTMQSVLQYRRLRAQVEQQYNRHIHQQEKPNSPSPPETALPGSSRHWDDSEQGLDAQQMHHDEVKASRQMSRPSHDAHALSRTATARSIGARLGLVFTGIAVHDRPTDVEERVVAKHLLSGLKETTTL